ncbi:MAG: class I SAM-dependent methyltransferase [Blastocatellales bacterium]|nr:class I SAM-dependent methyltransferase [Blastocatellales bacterium]
MSRSANFPIRFAGQTKQQAKVLIAKSASDTDIDFRCPACGVSKVSSFGLKGGYPLGRCDGCGTIFAPVDGATGKTRELYEHYYNSVRFDLPATAAATLERLVRSCERYRSLGRWLDIGYGEGGLLRIVESHGWKCHGTELSPQALDFGRSQGWIVASDPEKDSRFEPGGFDVVTMIEFIEHALEPSNALAQAARLLRPGGLLYLTTPNAGSINRRILGIDWSVISPPEHVTIWSAEGIKTALERVGLKVERVRTEGLNPGELIARLRLRRTGRNGGASSEPSRNDVAFALNEAMMRGRGRRMLKRGINHTLSALGIGDSLKVWARKVE